MPIHLDHHYASQTEFGRPLVDSTFTVALVTGQSVTDVPRTSSPTRLGEVRLPAQVFEGDTIYSPTESFKYHAACCHTHPAADALLKGMKEHDLTADDIAGVRARVHEAAIDVLGSVTNPSTIHQSKFSMGFVLALIAHRKSASLDDFTEESLEDSDLRAFHDKVAMALDAEVDAEYPRRWIGLVDIETTDGRQFTSRVDVPKGDPGNTLSREEIEEKALKLATYRDGTTPEELCQIVARTWDLENESDLCDLLPA